MFKKVLALRMRYPDLSFSRLEILIAQLYHTHENTITNPILISCRQLELDAIEDAISIEIKLTQNQEYKSKLERFLKSIELSKKILLLYSSHSTPDELSKGIASVIKESNCTNTPFCYQTNTDSGIHGYAQIYVPKGCSGLDHDVIVTSNNYSKSIYENKNHGIVILSSEEEAQTQLLQDNEIHLANQHHSFLEYTTRLQIIGNCGGIAGVKGLEFLWSIINGSDNRDQLFRRFDSKNEMQDIITALSSKKTHKKENPLKTQVRLITLLTETKRFLHIFRRRIIIDYALKVGIITEREHVQLSKYAAKLDQDKEVRTEIQKSRKSKMPPPIKRADLFTKEIPITLRLLLEFSELNSTKLYTLLKEKFPYTPPKKIEVHHTKKTAEMAGVTLKKASLVEQNQERQWHEFNSIITGIVHHQHITPIDQHAILTYVLRSKDSLLKSVSPEKIISLLKKYPANKSIYSWILNTQVERLSPSDQLSIVKLNQFGLYQMAILEGEHDSQQVMSLLVFACRIANFTSTSEDLSNLLPLLTQIKPFLKSKLVTILTLDLADLVAQKTTHFTPENYVSFVDMILRALDETSSDQESGRFYRIFYHIHLNKSDKEKDKLYADLKLYFSKDSNKSLIELFFTLLSKQTNNQAYVAYLRQKLTPKSEQKKPQLPINSSTDAPFQSNQPPLQVASENGQPQAADNKPSQDTKSHQHLPQSAQTPITAKKPEPQKSRVCTIL